jgi:hypothetical protein
VKLTLVEHSRLIIIGRDVYLTYPNGVEMKLEGVTIEYERASVAEIPLLVTVENMGQCGTVEPHE